MENEFKKRSQIEEILKASGAPAEALRILAGNYDWLQQIPFHNFITFFFPLLHRNFKVNEMLSNFHGDSYEFLMLLTSQMVLPRSLVETNSRCWRKG